jgi:hypothetical protein
MQQPSEAKQERLSPGGLADQDRGAESDDGIQGQSADDIDQDDDQDASRPGKRKRPMSVS